MRILIRLKRPPLGPHGVAVFAHDFAEEVRLGPDDLRIKLSGKELRVKFAGMFRARPSRIVLHIPPVPGLKTVILNGKPLKWDGKSESVVIAGK